MPPPAHSERTLSRSSRSYANPTSPFSAQWAVLIFLPVLLLRLERPNCRVAESHHRPMQHHKHQVEPRRCFRVRPVVISANSEPAHLLSRTPPPLRSPNPVAPYTLLVYTSYIPAPSYLQHHPLMSLQVTDRTVRHRCRRQPPICESDQRPVFSVHSITCQNPELDHSLPARDAVRNLHGWFHLSIRKAPPRC